MKILSTEQIREADKFTIQNEPISSIDLMERAASKCVEWLIEKYATGTRYDILCGSGNNGGDGLVIARQLAQKGNKVHVYHIQLSKNSTKDFDSNLERLNNTKAVALNLHTIKSAKDFTKTDISTSQGIIIDAMIGSGLNKAIKGELSDIIETVNNLSAEIIAVDCPTGLFGDALNKKQDSIIKATYTLTFQQPKLSFLFPENEVFVGIISILNIGLDQSFIDAQQSHYYLTTTEIAKQLLQPRSKHSHKGTFGHTLLILGSKGKVGAAILSSKACLRAGVGLLTVQAPKCAYEIMQETVPEAMVISDSDENIVSDKLNIEKYSAIGIGPGLGTEGPTERVLKHLIQYSSKPLVIDADAINILSKNKTWLAFLPNNSILTPHPKEFERIAGSTNNSFEKLQKQRELSIKHGIYIILKGAFTSIACPNGDVHFNGSGNPGMATGGSGDVLTGILTSLLSQQYQPMHACLLGVYLHGVAGDFAANHCGEESMIASDIIDYIGEGYKYLKK